VVLFVAVTKLPRLSSGLIAASIAAILLSGCQSSENGFCSTATDLRNSISQFDATGSLKLLDRDFWVTITSEVDTLIESTDGQVKLGLIEARSALQDLTVRLEQVDYNLLAALADPETAQSLTQTTTMLLGLMADELDAAIQSSC
jgi:hypothetical protein